MLFGAKAFPAGKSALFELAKPPAKVIAAALSVNEAEVAVALLVGAAAPFALLIVTELPTSMYPLPVVEFAVFDQNVIGP